MKASKNLAQVLILLSVGMPALIYGEDESSHKVAKVMDYLEEEQSDDEASHDKQEHEEVSSNEANIDTDIPATVDSELEDKTAVDSVNSKTDSTGDVLSGGLSIGSMVPIGTVQKGLRIPNLEQGQLTSLIEADLMTREEEEYLSFENMTISLYRDTIDSQSAIELDYQIDMKTARFLIESRILSGQSDSKVSGDNFSMTGDALYFDTRAGRGQMTGNVVMTLYNTADIISESPERVNP